MSRIDQINSLLREEIALALNRHLEIDGCLVTITEVHCAPDLSEAKIYFSVLPEKFVGTVLKKLRHLSGQLAHDLRPRLKFHHLPTFHWLFDEREVKASELDEVFNHLT